MPDDIDIRVSPSLDPETYRAIPGVNDETIKFVGGVVTAMNDAYVTLGQLHDARKAADGNPAWTPENRVLIVGREAEKHKQRILRRIDLASTDLTANIAHTEKLLSEPLTQQAGQGSLNGEVRSFARGLGRSEREALMRGALDGDDDATLTAILGAQPYLSGLTQIDHDHYLRLYHTKRNPHLVARLDVMQRFRDRLDRIGPVLHAQFEKAVGAKPNEVTAIRVADERATAALNIQPQA